MSASKQQELQPSDSADVMSLPPRREVHRKKRKWFKQTPKPNTDEYQYEELNEKEEIEHEPTLYYHRLTLHIVLILFLLTSMAIPIYYYFILP
ncbi:hypothetical protein [Alkalibacillus salilacus]|uniref:Uncharacterized protein n=1 Tax=Alkalibacillus salilacus TaxID=284582 RepID=A0ABT9VC71_9BACI|nr:hypothetical protein [Alkalibacillus salilacus]MDQ0158509.1 hypothetical protein [Alkalibacillus salilacus]